jgi:hypothetical protein
VQAVVNGDVGSLHRLLAELSQKVAEAWQTEVKNEGTFLVRFIGGCRHSELNSLRRIADDDAFVQGKCLPQTDCEGRPRIDQNPKGMGFW